MVAVIWVLFQVPPKSQICFCGGKAYWRSVPTLRGQPISDIKEVYVSSHRMGYPPVVESQLDEEFQDWDILSDKALMNFEQELD